MLKFNAYSERNGGYYSCVYTPRTNGKSVVNCTSEKQGYVITIAVEEGVDWRTAIAEHTLRLAVRGEVEETSHQEKWYKDYDGVQPW